MVESTYRRSLVLSGGDHTIFLEDPIAVGLLLASSCFIVFSLWRDLRDARRAVPPANSRKRIHDRACAAAPRCARLASAVKDAAPSQAARHDLPAACSSTSSASRSRPATPTTCAALVAAAAGDGPATAFGHDAPFRPLRCGARQRHGRAWGGFRRHVRRRAGARRRGRRPGGARARARRAACRRGGGTRHRGRRRADVPAEPRRAAGDPQGRLPPDGRARRAGGGRRGVGARCRLDAKRSARASASPAAWPPGSSSIWRTAAGPSGCMRARPRRPGCAQRSSPKPASSAR